MSGERGDIGADKFDALFGSKIANSLRNDGCGSLRPLPDFSRVAASEDFDVDKSRWGRTRIAYMVPKAYGGECLTIIFVNDQDGIAQPYMLDKDQERFNKIFGNGAVG